ncbi:MAG: pseudouridylate synthase [Myxococcales bacterium]|nr:pseudouridylate synthase [Myxococcales bacterium]
MEILYRDEHVVAVNKPSGVLVHRGWDNDKVVLMTEVRDAIDQWVYPVHRLDRGSSGVVLFALSSEVAATLGAEFAGQRVEKRYLALVRGVPEESGVIDHDIPKKEKGERVPAVSEYRRLAVAGRYSLVEVRPRTGRLHQIRRHMKHISCPLIGDVRYGKGEHNRHFRDNYGLHRLALHSHGLAVQHPRGAGTLEIRAPLPEELARAFVQLGVIESADAVRAFFDD